MPAYGAVTSYINSLLPGNIETLWSAESPVPGNGGAAASKAVALMPADTNPVPLGIDGKFSGAPGAFAVEVQVAQHDVEGEYQTISGGNLTAVDSVNFTFHLDALVIASFVRLLLRSRANAVSITATARRG